MKIRDKLLLTFITIALSFGVLGYIEHRHIGELAHSSQSLHTQRTPILTALLELITAVRRASIKAVEYTMQGKLEDQAKAHEALVQIDQQLQRFLALNQDISAKSIIDDLVARIKGFTRILDEYLTNSEGYNIEQILSEEERLHKSRASLVRTINSTMSQASDQLEYDLLLIKSEARKVSVKAIEYSLRGKVKDRDKALEAMEALHLAQLRYASDSSVATQLAQQLVAYISMANQYLNQVPSRRYSVENIYATEQELHATRKKLIHTLYSLVDYHYVEFGHTTNTTSTQIEQATRLHVNLHVLVTVLAMLAGILLARSISAPLNMLSTLVKRFGHGETIAPEDVPVKGALELRQLGQSVAGMIRERDALENSRQQAQEALRANEQRLTLLLNTLPYGIQENDTEGVITYSNIAHHRILGFSPGELIGHHIWDFEADSKLEQKLRGELASLVAEQPSPKPYIAHNITKEGREVSLEINWDYQRDAVGTLTGFISVISDITAREQAELALKTSEARYRELVDNMSDSVAVYKVMGNGEDFVFSEYNRAAERVSGIPRDEVIGRPVREVFPGVDALDLYELFKRVWRSGVPEHYPVNLYQDECLTLWLESYVFKLPNDEIVAIYEDSTERKKAEIALAQSEERFRNLVESSQDWVWETDAQGVYTYASPRCQELLGYESEEIVGRAPFDLMPETEAKRVQAKYQHILTEAAPIVALENVNLHRDGHNVVLETSGVPFFDKCGSLAGYRGMGRDITERKRVEESLRESEARYRAVFNQQFQFMAILSPEGTTLEINELLLRVTGCKREDFVGKPFWRSPTWKGLPEWQEIMQKRLVEASLTEGPIQTEDIYQTLDGTTRYADAAVKAIRDEAGNILFFLAQASDTTERRCAEQDRIKLVRKIQQLNKELEQRVQKRTAELKAANKELESFAYSVSHDLRAPLRAIDGFSQALVEDYGKQLDHTALDYLRRVREGAQRMGMLIDDLLQLSRMSRGELKLEEVDLSEIAKTVVLELKASEPNRRVELILDVDMRVRGDARLLGVMLENLLGNAWKFTGRESRPRIIFRRQADDSQVFYIRDNGVGFDMRYADKLFGAFQRLHRATDFPGTGIGLATVQRIVQRHGGRIWAEAQEGKGATFYFSLEFAVKSQIEPAKQRGET